MNESSVSSPFMSGLRKRLPGSVVTKHRDASMIGLPDCSVTYGSHVLWLEFKLFEWQDWMFMGSANVVGSRLLARATQSAETQRSMMEKLHHASGSLYIIWVKKSFVLVIDPERHLIVDVRKTASAVEFVADLMEKWSTCLEFPLIAQ